MPKADYNPCREENRYMLHASKAASAGVLFIVAISIIAAINYGILPGVGTSTSTLVGGSLDRSNNNATTTNESTVTISPTSSSTTSSSSQSEYHNSSLTTNSVGSNYTKPVPPALSENCSSSIGGYSTPSGLSVSAVEWFNLSTNGSSAKYLACSQSGTGSSVPYEIVDTIIALTQENSSYYPVLLLDTIKFNYSILNSTTFQFSVNQSGSQSEFPSIYDWNFGDGTYGNTTQYTAIFHSFHHSGVFYVSVSMSAKSDDSFLDNWSLIGNFVVTINLPNSNTDSTTETLTNTSG